MKITKNILGFLMVIVLLVESIGIQIIRDRCMPCHKESIEVQLVYKTYETHCHDGCHSDEIHVCKSIDCCTGENCSHKDHEHNHDIKILQKYPDFSVTKIADISKLIPVLVVVFNSTISDQLFLQQSLLCFNFDRNKPIPPETDLQSFLCTYLI